MGLAIYNPEISDLLKEATKYKKESNLTDAINCLRRAYQLMENTETLYTVDTYLRLPSYLQQANRMDEAWNELCNIKNMVSNNYTDKFLYYSNMARVEHKMSLFLKHTQKYIDSLLYAVYSNLSLLNVLHIRLNDRDFEEIKERTNDEIQEIISNKYLSDYFQRTLKNTPYYDRWEIIVDIVSREIATLPILDYADISQKLRSALK